MASQDNIESLLEMLAKDKIDFVFIAVQPGKERSQVRFHKAARTKKADEIILQAMYQYFSAMQEQDQVKKRSRRNK